MVWLRRARPLLGTLVEVGVSAASDDDACAQTALAAAFAAIAQVQTSMSAFDATSDIGRFNAAARGSATTVSPDTARVLRAARDLFNASQGDFDVARGTGGWILFGDLLIKLDDATRIDLGGIAKGYAVDAACDMLQAQGVEAAWVNAGGDLRSVGVAVPVGLRDETQGGVRPWIDLQDAALATSYFGADQPERLHGAAHARHVSVRARQCMWADGLTKVIARQGRADEALLRRYHAHAWIHNN